ncbi:hypothetical protein CFP65_6840 [Kitasatospora sp. MMS16-BH015]|uniref:PKD domain-containing protein n=1 Tax=Kitasatospora sp. MMS16-BH015 TaxID=2018025 RepID=UPI000CA34A90|nr:right-handed parallel beta-helix repeat-containing protein [Kitasatospora sp. MMS16-BH015]AUG81472.1 hypothetical protein CFP65_6840 [Kitasatospora sp. MMS16-BH015]
MRLRNFAGLASATSVVLGIGMPGLAVADSSTLYVDQSTSAHCADIGANAGTKQQPYCTIQAAADAAQPGQTVQVAGDNYDETVTITHSGAPGKPITFLGATRLVRGTNPPRVGIDRSGGGRMANGFVLKGVQDIRISGFTTETTGEGFVVSDATRVTLEGNEAYSGSDSSPSTAAVRVSGATSGVGITRNKLHGGRTSVVVDAGISGVLVNGNSIEDPAGDGVQITDAPGAVVTGNTVDTVCGPAIALLGASGNAVVENNVLAATAYAADHQSCGQPSAGVNLTVSAASTAGTKVDYNLVDPVRGLPGYSWGGQTYATSAAFAKAVAGQGTHDLTADPGYGAELDLREGSPAIDSADANAPGATDTDVYGYHRIDDPNDADSGTGVGYLDRGAYEFTTSNDLFHQLLDQPKAPVGGTVTLTGKPEATWSPVVSYRYDFGDGTQPVATTDGSVQHAYTAVGLYNASVRVLLANGDVLSYGGAVLVTADAPLVAKMSVTDGLGPLDYFFSGGDSSTPWSIAGYTFDYGDGTAQAKGWGGRHQYRQEGDYTVTMTVADSGGRTARTTQVVHARYQLGAFHAVTPSRVLDTRSGGGTLGPGQSLTWRVGPSLSPMPQAVVLNVTAVNHGGGGYLTVYPAGADRPKTSNVNFTGGQVVPNLVTVPVNADGSVTFFNSSGNTDVVADLFGYYQGTTNEGVIGDRFTAQAPTRLLDTRAPGQHAVQAGAPVELQVRGQHGVPADATAAVLNVTATRGTRPGYFSLYPEAGKPTGTSNLNLAAGQTVANQVLVPIGADGKVRLSNFAGSADAVVDLFGYYSPSGQSLFRPTTPVRLVDTRGAGHGPLGAGGSIAVSAGAPAGATGAVLNVTATAPTNPGYLTVWADGAARPGTSNLNFLAGETVPNHVTTPLSPAGKFDVYNFSGSTQVVADLFGYFVKQ